MHVPTQRLITPYVIAFLECLGYAYVWVQLPDPLPAFHVFNFRWVCAVGGSGNETTMRVYFVRLPFTNCSVSYFIDYIFPIYIIYGYFSALSTLVCSGGIVRTIIGNE